MLTVNRVQLLLSPLPRIDIREDIDMQTMCAES